MMASYLRAVGLGGAVCLACQGAVPTPTTSPSPKAARQQVVPAAGAPTAERAPKTPTCRRFADVDALCASWIGALREEWKLEPVTPLPSPEGKPAEPMSCGLRSTSLHGGAKLHRLTLQVLRGCGGKHDLLAPFYTEPSAYSCRDTVQDELTLIAIESRGAVWPILLTENYDESNGPVRKMDLTVDRYKLEEFSYFLRRTFHDGHHEAESDNLRGDILHVQLSLTRGGPVVQSRESIGEIFHGGRLDQACYDACTDEEDNPCSQSCIRFVQEESQARVEHVSPCELRFYEPGAPRPDDAGDPNVVEPAGEDEVSVSLCCAKECEAPPLCAEQLWTKVEDD